jgi:dUTP pyrophosphatase
MTERNDVCRTCGKMGAHYVRDKDGPWHKLCIPPKESFSAPAVQTSVAVRFRRIGNHDLPLPACASGYAAGLDLMSTKSGLLRSGEWLLWPTGWAIEMPDGYEAQVRPRSGLALKHGVTVLNAPGTIDGDYRGEIGVVLINHGTAAHTVRVGDRIAQLVVAPVSRVSGVEVAEIGETARGAGAFGSTGT